MTALPARNLLGDETSPYLLQHKDNPVHWRPWSAETLAEAAELNKPILLSVGYAACHWCHVMAHESFENPETAALMNEHFINIKVDREERPDVDVLYQSALAVMGQQGGWPLTMFLTPVGEPVVGGTYFPPTDNMGRPAFQRVLGDVAKLFAERGPEVAKNAQAIREQLDKAWTQTKQSQFNLQLPDIVARKTAQRIDLFYGGFDGAPKFPNVPQLELVWRAFMRSGIPQYAQQTVTTLDNMCQGGIYDHLGGGFARYAVDERWLVPHFEKMLYDNAQMIDILTLVQQHTRSPLYQQRVDETVAWAIREMQTPDGGFAASIDADSEGREGAFYVWTETEIDAVLGADSQFFKQVYGVLAKGNFEGGHNILHRLNVMSYLRPEQEAVLSRSRKALFKAREKRVRPSTDDKILSDWNGLMIAALANASAVFRRLDWNASAVRAFWFVAEKMGDGGTLYHTWRGGKRQHQATSEGYAAMIRAALALFEVTGDERYLEHAKKWTKTLNDRFWDKKEGGYFLTADNAERLIIRTKTATDSATPAANGTMIASLTRLFMLTGDSEYKARSNALVECFAGRVEQTPFALASYMNGVEFLIGNIQIVIVGNDRDPQTLALARAVYDRSIPNRLLLLLPPNGELPSTHIAHGKKMVDGKPTAYVCTTQRCSAPITDPAALANGLTPVAFARQQQMPANQP